MIISDLPACSALKKDQISEIIHHTQMNHYWFHGEDRLYTYCGNTASNLEIIMSNGKKYYTFPYDSHDTLIIYEKIMNKIEDKTEAFFDIHESSFIITTETGYNLYKERADKYIFKNVPSENGGIK